jgi:hypothetical protein
LGDLVLHVGAKHVIVGQLVVDRGDALIKLVKPVLVEVDRVGEQGLEVVVEFHGAVTSRASW